MVRWLLVLALASAAVGACTLFDEDPPDDSCEANTDCFQAQGEVCNVEKHKCEVPAMVDAGVDAPMADAGVDAP